jgi:hypothetical protein
MIPELLILIIGWGKIGARGDPMEPGTEVESLPSEPEVVVVKQALVRETLNTRNEDLVHALYDGIDLGIATTQISSMHIRDSVKVLKDAHSCIKEVKIDHKITGFQFLAMLPVVINED